MKHEKLIENIEIPKGCEFKIDSKNMIIKGPKGELTRKVPDKKIKIENQNNELQLLDRKSTRLNSSHT